MTHAAVMGLARSRAATAYLDSRFRLETPPRPWVREAAARFRWRMKSRLLVMSTRSPIQGTHAIPYESNPVTLRTAAQTANLGARRAVKAKSAAPRRFAKRSLAKDEGEGLWMGVCQEIRPSKAHGLARGKPGYVVMTAMSFSAAPIGHCRPCSSILHAPHHGSGWTAGSEGRGRQTAYK